VKKIGILVLAMVVALGALGAAYAAWTDTVTISGTVNTGSVDIEVVNQSNTWVWKVIDDPDYPNEIAVMHQYEYDPANSSPPSTSGTVVGLIAYADADCPVGSPAQPDDTVLVTFDNLFPSIDFTADFLLHYAGSIPAKVEIANLNYTPVVGPDLSGYISLTYWMATWDPTTPSVAPTKVDYDPTTAEIDPIPSILGYQLHECNYILVEITIHLPQDNTLQGASGDLSGQIQVIQWNESTY
jgi:predicted ribosomally synthesized peptide with SipW-like signal peptide